MTITQETDGALLPCPNPWCEAGERDGDFRPQVHYSNFGMVYVACTSCTMAGPTKQHEIEAIAAWNTRPTPAQEQGWRDIATMPLWEVGVVTDGEQAAISQKAQGDFDEGDEHYFSIDPEDALEWQPTYWMPLPSTPTEGAQ